MYSELIYTRCGQGIDILKGGLPVASAGFKTFSCSEDLVRSGANVDLLLLHAAAQRKESYDDPNFMDDAYLFVTPEYGQNIIVNFHPRRFNPDAPGNYAHRPGNFINQIFVGTFGDFYPYETFGDESLWDAQNRSEAFYYENEPKFLEGRDCLATSNGWITLDDVTQFVADGRREALMNAIAFVVSQFALAPEERKFLVVKDENSRNIELWIAAIERAFSPRIAAALSFATRLDRFAESNIIAVDSDGKYQSQIDFQNSKQRLRFRALIVGVDERDRINANSVGTAQRLPYVVLDGRSKTLSVDVDASHPYYRYAADYGGERDESFFEEFLQSSNLFAPSKDLFTLYEAFDSLKRFYTERQSKELVNALSILSRFQLLKTPWLENLYDSIRETLDDCVGDESFFDVVAPQLKRLSQIVGTTFDEETVRESILRTCADNIFTRPNNKKTKDVYRVVLKSAYSRDAVRYLTSQETIDAYDDNISDFTPEDWLAFSELFTDSMRKSGARFSLAIETCLLRSVDALYFKQDERAAYDVVSMYAECSPDETTEALIKEAGANDNEDYVDFLLKQATRIALAGLSSDKRVASFYAELQKYGFGYRLSDLLLYKAQRAKHTRTKECLLTWIRREGCNAEIDVAPILETFDKNLNPFDRSSADLATLIQDVRPDNLKCANSARVCALKCLSYSRLSDEQLRALEEFLSQGLLCDANNYDDLLIEKAFNPKLPYNVFEVVVAATENSEFYMSRVAKRAIDSLETREKSVAAKLIVAAFMLQSETIARAIADALSNVKKFDKKTNDIRSMLMESEIRRRSKKINDSVLNYFEQIVAEAGKIYDQNHLPDLKKNTSFFGRMFRRDTSTRQSEKEMDNVVKEEKRNRIEDFEESRVLPFLEERDDSTS